MVGRELRKKNGGVLKQKKKVEVKMGAMRLWSLLSLGEQLWGQLKTNSVL